MLTVLLALLYYYISLLTILVNKKSVSLIEMFIFNLRVCVILSMVKSRGCNIIDERVYIQDGSLKCNLARRI